MNIKIKYIVSDLNGTLVDAMPIYTRVFCDVLKRHTEIENPDIPDIVKYSVAATGTPWDEQFAYVLDLHKYPTDEVPKLMDEFCNIVNEKKYSLYPKVEELLQTFKEKGYRVLITSGSSTGAMIKRIYDLGILNYRLSQNYSGFYIWVKIATFIFFHDIYYIESTLYEKFDFSVSYVQKIRSKAAILTSTQFGGVCF